MWVDETREHWDNVVLNWTQYKEDSNLGAKEASRQLVAFYSDELHTILNRTLESQQFMTEETELLKQPDEGIRRFLSRLKDSHSIVTLR